MISKKKFIIGGLVILAALGYLVYSGVSQSVVYFVTPSELGSPGDVPKPTPLAGKDARGAAGAVWSPDSKRLAFHNSISGEAFVVDVDTGALTPIGNGFRPTGWVDEDTLIVAG